RPMRTSNGVCDHPVHARACHAGDDNPVDTLAAPKNLPPEIPGLPASKRLSALRPKPPAPKRRPLDARIPNINQQDRPQVVALTDTSPEMNFFSPCGVSTRSAP